MTKKEFYLSLAGKGDFFAPMKEPVKSDLLYKYVKNNGDIKPLTMKDGKYFISTGRELEEETIENGNYVATLTFKQEGRLKREVIFKDIRRKDH